MLNCMIKDYQHAVPKKSMVYVLCPANYTSGGPDALHQIAFYLNKIGLRTCIVYKTLFPQTEDEVSIPEQYKIYVDSFLREDDIIDNPENFIIMSELDTGKINKFKRARILFWWLSVDKNLEFLDVKQEFFYLLTLPLRIVISCWIKKKYSCAEIIHFLNNKKYSFHNESPNVTHICASYYAYDYVSRRSKNPVVKCIEPISKLFLDIYSQEKKNISKQNRKNVILYNPIRKYNHILDKISSIAPELKFEPLRGLTQQQLIEKYKTSKLYIDFGAFPGAERIPKEAVLFGCAIITGKRGASGFHGDVPIPDEYKFGDPEKQIKEIVEKIRFVLNNYENVYSDFDEYRNTVLNLEENFIKSLKEVFLQQE